MLIDAKCQTFGVMIGRTQEGVDYDRGIGNDFSDVARGNRQF